MALCEFAKAFANAARDIRLASGKIRLHWLFHNSVLVYKDGLKITRNLAATCQSDQCCSGLQSGL